MVDQIRFSARFLKGLIAFLGILFIHSADLHAAEDWKGSPDSDQFTIGVITGVGIVDSNAGLNLIGTIGRKIVEGGFVPDINNRVFIELQAGPLFTAGSHSVFYSTHLRWDFRKTDDWGLYALGGLSGYTASRQIGNPFEFFPRFGVGTLYRLQDSLWLRAEMSHELSTVGVLFSF